ncbi:MAG: hypothetical protein Q8N44_15800, partial [Rubrivivax sp.]|nr:hypothetical protein [Rubrivivax sp.]
LPAPPRALGALMALFDLGRALLARPRPALSHRASEAAAVRTMAWRMQSSDPGFASDLLAAADRHDREA